MYDRRMISLRLSRVALETIDKIALEASGDSIATHTTRSEVIRAAVAVALRYPDEVTNQIARTKEQP